MKFRLFSIIAYLRPFGSKAIGNVVFNILSVVFSLVSLTMVMPFLQLLFDKERLVMQPPTFRLSAEWATQYFYYYLSHYIVTYGKPQALLFVCGVVSIVFLLKNLFRYLAAYFMAFIRNGVVKEVRSKVFSKIMQLPLSYFSNERKGDLMTRLTADVQEIEYSIMSVLEILFREPLTIIAYLGAMFFISPTLSLFVLGVLPLTAFVIGRIGRSLKAKSHLAQERLSALMNVIEETLSGLRIIKGFGAEQQQQGRFERENYAHFALQTAVLQRRELSSPLSEFLTICVVCFVLYVGGRMVLDSKGGLSADTFIGFMLIFSQIIPSAKSLSNAVFQLQKGMASIERVNVVLAAPITISDAPNAKPIARFEHEIKFDKVYFGYGVDNNNNVLALKNINITLPKGKILALVGPSGAGKSTLADLLPRFYDVSDGCLQIDGQDIRDLRTADLRGLMGIVSQEAVLFNDTVFNNIAFGADLNTVTLADVQAAAKVANAHHFIEALPQGYNTNIGDRGSKLSGGERQRLTIARAVLKNPPILILDEATSSLDTASERAVQDALTRLMQDRTCLVIAHRLSTVQFADEIVVLQNGEIVERGTHVQLMSLQKGLYKKLVEMQNGTLT